MSLLDIKFTEPKLKDFKCFRLPIDNLPKYKEVLIFGNVYNFFGTFIDGDFGFARTSFSGEGSADNFMNFGQFVLNGGHATIIASKETCEYYRRLYKEFFKAGFGTTHPNVTFFEIDEAEFLTGKFKVKEGKEEKIVKGEYFWSQDKKEEWSFNWLTFLKTIFKEGEKRNMSVIMNPPYQDGLYKGITKYLLSCLSKENLDLAELCPWEFVDNYRTKSFWETIDPILGELEFVDNGNKTYFDIGKDELAILQLGEKKDSLENHQKKDKYRDSSVSRLLFEYSKKNPRYEVIVTINRKPDIYKGKINNSLLFAKAMRGVFHFGGNNVDYLFNQGLVDINWAGDSSKYGTDLTVLVLKSEKEKENLCKWVYNSELAKYFLKEFCDSFDKYSNSCFGAFIPFVDWSEEWTDEKIIDELKLKDVLPEDWSL